MGRCSQLSIDEKIKRAEASLIKAKTRYDVEARTLKDLPEKKMAMKKQELLAAVVSSKHSYNEILGYINSDPDSD